MNPACEVDRLLNEHGAVLVRQKKHLVYRLPNGQNFVVAKTTSDPARAAHNNLSELRHALGIVGDTKQGEEPTMAIDQRSAPGVSAPPPQKPAAPAASPQQRPAALEPLRLRIEAAISTEEASQEKLLAEAQAHERRAQMLKALLPFADDPATEDSLRAILPSLRAPAPEPPPAPDPPQAITERVQVTRQLVFAATQTFDEPFTINDVMSLMTGQRCIDPAERTRIRSSIAQSIIALFERGELLKESEHFGRTQTIWRKAAMAGKVNGHGTGNGDVVRA